MTTRRWFEYRTDVALNLHIWPQLQRPLREAWSGYVDGSSDRDDCCDRLAAALNL